MLALALAAGAVGQALWAAGQQGWTYDEAFHLGWSERFLDDGVSERASQERFNSKTPITLPNVLARKLARAAGVTDAGALRLFARAPSVGLARPPLRPRLRDRPGAGTPRRERWPSPAPRSIPT